MKLVQNGQATVKAEVKERGNRPRTLHSEETTEAVGPFTLDAVHARVRASLRVTPSKDYQSISVECSVEIPVPATPEGVAEGYAYAFDFCDTTVSKKMAKLRKALNNMAE